MNLQSELVKVFPAGKYRSTQSADYTSRIFYEQNVSNLIRQIIDVPGFIISGSVNTNGIVTEDFNCNLYGYNFILENGADLVAKNLSNIVVNIDGNPLGNNQQFYVYLGIKLTSSESGISELNGQDALDTNENSITFNQLVYQGLDIFNDSSLRSSLTDYVAILPILVGYTNGDGTLYTDTSASGNPNNLIKIYTNSYAKFDISSLNITRIDGKNWLS